MNHKNDERTVRCPVEGCDATPLARGINLHVMKSSGDGHGPRGEVPEHLDFENLETVGTDVVEMDYPEERDTENVARLCPYCSRPWKGKNGVLIHLGQVAGRKNHPKNAAERHSEDDFPRVEVDEQGNITSVVDDAAPSRDDAIENGAVPVQQVYQLIAKLVSENQQQAARQVRQHLIEEDTATRPLRKAPPHQDLYHALLSLHYTDQTHNEIAAILEDDGIRVTCRGVSAVLTSDEARDIAAGLEQAGSEQDKGVSDLIEFLHRGVDILEDSNQKQKSPKKFGDWR
jgi:hypothetical protein